MYQSLLRGHNRTLKTQMATAGSLRMSDRVTIDFAFRFRTLIGM
jgi:hypothetical protein